MCARARCLETRISLKAPKQAISFHVTFLQEKQASTVNTVRVGTKAILWVTIFTQPLQADSTEGLREYCDGIEISVEYFNILNREHSRKISAVVNA